jgi:hypothetical protein
MGQMNSCPGLLNDFSDLSVGFIARGLPPAVARSGSVYSDAGPNFSCGVSTTQARAVLVHRGFSTAPFFRRRTW